MPKKPLPERVEIDVIARLKRVSDTRKISLSEVISLALDSLEGTREVAQTITDRIEFLERNLAALVDLMEVFDAKIDQHFSNETKRLKTMYLLIKANMNDHDQSEKERFENLTPRVF
jgi:hypothetical protein